MFYLPPSPTPPPKRLTISGPWRAAEEFLGLLSFFCSLNFFGVAITVNSFSVTTPSRNNDHGHFDHVRVLIQCLSQLSFPYRQPSQKRTARRPYENWGTSQRKCTNKCAWKAWTTLYIASSNIQPDGNTQKTTDTILSGRGVRATQLARTTLDPCVAPV